MMTKEQIQSLLDRNDRAVERAILVIFENQTESEKNSETTNEDNGVGFSKFDAEFLSSLAKQLQKGSKLTERQMVYGRKKIKKYWRQLQAAAEAKSQSQIDFKDAA